MDICPLNLEPELITRTDRWLVINKPAGWLTIPGRGDSGAPVVSEWARKIEPRSQVVHRLDRETSGLILFAIGPEAHREAGLWFQNREMKKLYVCLAQGKPLRPLLKIQNPIDGAPCTTQVEVKERFADAFSAHVRPLTGRRHQIRIHLSESGHPILGDTQYGGSKALANRVALHAMSLELPTGEKFEASLPEDFMGWLRELRG